MSLRKRLSPVEVESVYSAANSAIWYSHHLAHRLSRRAAREEDFVATLVTNGVEILANRWADILSHRGVSIAVAGVFCHGHPQVSFGSPRSRVELADLLIVHFNTSRIRSTAKAMLIQAKVSSDATHRLPNNDPQLRLYSSWPGFEFVTGGLKRGIRNIKEAGKGSRYALVYSEQSYPEEIKWADQCPWASCAAKQDLAAERSLSKLLGDILLGKDGRTFSFKMPKDDWSRTIKELLEITGRKTYMRKNIGRTSTPRLTISGPPLDSILYLSNATPFQGSAALPQSIVSSRFFGSIPEVQDSGDERLPPDMRTRNDNEGGISTLIIETRETEG